jgi:hypothetical protein
MVGLVLMGPPAWAQATRQAEWDALNAQVGQLYQEGKYTEAINVAQVALKKAKGSLVLIPQRLLPFSITWPSSIRPRDNTARQTLFSGAPS